MIVINNLTKTLGGKEVLKDLSWTISDNSVYGLVGPNGIGKSTLLRCIANIYTKNEGEIIIDEISSTDVVATNKLVAYVSDDPFFFKNFTLDDMKDYFKLFYQSFDDDYYQELVTTFQLQTKKQLSTFSKGMKRQASLILYLALKPRYLLLDEAFDGLDPLKRVTFKKILIKELEDRDLTVIIASHNLREIEDIADSICMMDNGKVIFSNNSDVIKASYHKFQVAYKDPITTNLFDPLKPLSVVKKGKVYEVVSKLEESKILSYLNSTHPLILEKLDLSIEEVFILEVEK